jgi:hypothetical protein
MTNQVNDSALQELTADMQTKFKKSWWQPILKFTALGKLLSENLNPGNTQFLQTYRASWTWMQWLFKRFFLDTNQNSRFTEIVTSFHNSKEAEPLAQSATPEDPAAPEVHEDTSVPEVHEDTSVPAVLDVQSIIASLSPFYRYGLFVPTRNNDDSNEPSTNVRFDLD